MFWILCRPQADVERASATFSYLTAVLHSSSYRRRYSAQLKSDFPRVPLPRSGEVFWQLVPLGEHVGAMHLLES